MAHSRVGDYTVITAADHVWQHAAVIYARISEDHERAESIPTQISNSAKHAERMGWEVVRVFKDKGRSGYSGELRPEFEEMLEFLSKGEVQVLIARHHDRLTRNAEDFDRLMKVCGKSKIKISTYTGGELDMSTARAGSTASWRPAWPGRNQRSGASA